MDAFWTISPPHNSTASGGLLQPPLQQEQLLEPPETENTLSMPITGGGEEQQGPSAIGEAAAEQETAVGGGIGGSTFLEQMAAVAAASGAASGGDEITERDKILCLLSHFDRDQLDRYEAFRRGAFPKSVIRMIMQQVSGRPVSQNAVIAMAGITKVYIGEIVEEAIRFREQQMRSARLLQQGDGGERPPSSENGEAAVEEGQPKSKEPLKPSHIHEAIRRLSEKVIQRRPPEFRL